MIILQYLPVVAPNVTKALENLWIYPERIEIFTQNLNQLIYEIIKSLYIHSRRQKQIYLTEIDWYPWVSRVVPNAHKSPKVYSIQGYFELYISNYMKLACNCRRILVSVWELQCGRTNSWGCNPFCSWISKIRRGTPGSNAKISQLLNRLTHHPFACSKSCKEFYED